MSVFAPPARLGLAITLLITMISGCGVARPTPATPEPTAAIRPAVPDGWEMLATGDGSIRLAVPPDLGAIDTGGDGLLAQAPIESGAIPFEVSAVVIGPELGRPAAGESMFQYAQRLGFLPQAADGLTFGSTEERHTVLPVGPAVEIRTVVQPGTPDESAAALYWIDTGARLVLLRFVGTRAALAERQSDIDLISRLMEDGE